MLSLVPDQLFPHGVHGSSVSSILWRQASSLVDVISPSREDGRKERAEQSGGIEQVMVKQNSIMG